jgi:hypothetical protein
MPSAFDVSEGAGALSMIRQAAPCRASSQAIVNPTGPAPTTSTSVADFMNFDPGKFFLNAASAFQVILVTNQAAGSKVSA